MSKESRAKQALRSLLGIVYQTPDTPEIIPIIPEHRNNDGSLGKLVGELQPFIDDKKKLYKQYSELKNNHLVEGLLSKVTTDILQKGKPKDQPFINGVEYEPDPKVAEICETVLKTYRIEDHIREILYDTLVYGEYYMFIDHKNKELDDRYEYYQIMPIYVRSEVAQVLKHVSGVSNDKSKTIEPHELFFLSLSIPGQRIKLRLTDKSGSKYYIKVSTPFILPSIIGLLHSITLMELLMPLAQLMKIDKGQVVTVNMPPGTQIKQMFSAAKEYERELNNRFSSSLGGDFSFDSVQAILQSFGKYKVLPSIGGQKPSMEVRDMPMARDIEMQDFEYLVSTVANRLNVPVSYIYFVDREDSRQRMAYLAKLQAIRDGIALSVKRFLVDYLEHRRVENVGKISIDPSKLKVKIPEVPGVESIDTVDYMDALSGTMSNIQNIIDGFGRLLMDMPPEIDKGRLINMLNSKLEPVLGDKIFSLKGGSPESGESEPDSEWSQF